MHTRKMTLLTRAGVLAVVLSATPSGYARADGTNPPPVVVTPGNGHNILIGVNSPDGGAPVGSGGGGASAGNGSGGGAPAGGGSGGTIVPVGSTGAYQGGSNVGSNPFAPMGFNNLSNLNCSNSPLQIANCMMAAAPAPAAAGAPAAPPPPTSAQLAQAAFGELVMPLPVPSRYPSGILKESGHPYTIVNANTWFWIDPGTFQPVSKTVTAGAVWGKATATPVSLGFTPGDGSHSVSCPGPGSPWKANDQTWLAPVNPQGCSYRYLQSSLGVGGDDQVTATYTITWNVTWTGSDGTGGAFNNMQSQTTSRFGVAEVQTVVVN
jgi:hypothetical protein